MAETILMRRSLGVLRPIDQLGEEVLAGIAGDEVVKVEVTRPRNLGHHRKFYGLVKAVFPHQKLYPTSAKFVAAMKCALGYGEPITLPDGRVVLVPDSISFAKMDQTAFEEFYERALHLIETRILPGINREDVNREVAEIIEGRRAA